MTNLNDFVLISRDDYTVLCIMLGLGWGLLLATMAAFAGYISRKEEK